MAMRSAAGPHSLFRCQPSLKLGDSAGIGEYLVGGQLVWLTACLRGAAEAVRRLKLTLRSNYRE